MFSKYAGMLVYISSNIEDFKEKLNVNFHVKQTDRHFIALCKVNHVKLYINFKCTVLILNSYRFQDFAIKAVVYKFGIYRVAQK